jgi:hypothetical protein
MNCPKCGTSNATGATVCASCGTAISPSAGTGTSGPHIPEFAKDIITPGLIARVKNIILTPATEWPVIDAEPSSPRAIYVQYVAPLAAIGAIAGFIGNTLIGRSYGFLGTYRTPIVSGLVASVVAYVLAFVGVFLVALIVDALAPTFGAQKDSLKALKVAAYSGTAGWVAGVLLILPSLAIIVGLAGLYGIYLLYLGLPVLMRCPKDKAIAYTAVTFVCMIVVYIVIGAITAAMVGVGSVGIVR